MTKRATERPQGFAKPAHWTNDPAPPPQPRDAQAESGAAAEPLSPTRYGDWVVKGIAIDF